LKSFVLGKLQTLNTRESTAVSSINSEVMILKTSELELIFQEFPEARDQMIKLTIEKQSYFKFLKKQVKERYSDTTTIEDLVKKRMQ
jgi:hypothetical protein